MTTYREFLDAHRSRANRIGHLVALVAGLAVAATCGLIFGWPWCAIALPIIGIGGGLSHRFFEGNSPAFFKRPWEIPLLLAYDVRMGLETTGIWLALIAAVLLSAVVFLVSMKVGELMRGMP